MVTLDKIISHYKPLVEKKVGAIQSGKFYHYYHVNSPWLIEDADIDSIMRAVFDMMYETLNELRQQDATLFPRIAANVRHTVIDDVVDFVEKEEDFGSAKERFIERLFDLHKPEKGKAGAQMKIFPPIMAYIFLEVLRRNPEKRSVVYEDSVYFPHRLFLAATPTSDVEREIAAVIPTMYSINLLNVVGAINNHMEPGTSCTALRLGKYISYPPVVWKQSANAKELDMILSPPEVKKEIYNTLAECFFLIVRTARTGRKTANELQHFRTSPMHYAVALDSLKAYARNQMLYTFKATEGQAFANTPITKYAGLRGKIEGNVLLITDSHRGVTERLMVDSSYRDTTTNLAFCAYLLNKIYWRAEDINARQKPTS